MTENIDNWYERYSFSYCLFFRSTETNAKPHRHKRCLFSITAWLTRSNNAECVKTVLDKKRTKPIFVSQLVLPPDWAAPLRETSHRKTLPLRTQQDTLMCKCMQGVLRKDKITKPNEVASLKLFEFWIITVHISGTFYDFLWNNDFWFNWGKSKTLCKVIGQT